MDFIDQQKGIASNSNFQMKNKQNVTNDSLNLARKYQTPNFIFKTNKRKILAKKSRKKSFF